MSQVRLDQADPGFRSECRRREAGDELLEGARRRSRISELPMLKDSELEESVRRAGARAPADLAQQTGGLDELLPRVERLRELVAEGVAILLVVRGREQTLERGGSIDGFGGLERTSFRRGRF